MNPTRRDPSKGDETRRAILDQAVDLSSEVGLEGLTIGSLAKRSGLSKSGLYAHFDSKEALQCEVLDATAAAFVDRVVAPSLKEPRGLQRLRALFERWLDWECEEHSGGCPFVAATVEFDDRPGVVRKRVMHHLKDLLELLSQGAETAIVEGDLDEALDPENFAFEVWGLLLSFQTYSRLLERKDAQSKALGAFEALLQRWAPASD